MPEQLASYITDYGYLAIFSLVFLQEIGIPNPVPNELVLLFSGYLASVGTLSFPLVFLSAVSADFIGTTVLFFAFYFFGEYILDHKPKWLPISHAQIAKLGEKIAENDKFEIYLGRLIPYIRGYVSVAAGLLEVKPKAFLISVVASAVTWSGGYVILGKILGPYWEKVAEKAGWVQSAIFLVVVAVAVIILIKYLHKRKKDEPAIK
ncbi:MAG: DedA family protein [Candidatus Pacebacteria bacterium]|nr:DedA family protein [Candidatus Paceibacterota bacterium]